jgi:hypothetical protein
MRSRTRRPAVLSAAFDYSSGVLGRLELIFSSSSNRSSLAPPFRATRTRCALLSTDFVIITKHSAASEGNVIRAFKSQ